MGWVGKEMSGSKQEEKRLFNWARLKPWVVVFEEDANPKCCCAGTINSDWGSLRVMCKMAF